MKRCLILLLILFLISSAVFGQRRIGQAEYSNDDPAFARYGCAAVACAGVVQSMTGITFTKNTFDFFILTNKRNKGFIDNEYTVEWATTLNSALSTAGSEDRVVGLVRLNGKGEEIDSTLPKNWEGTYCPMTVIKRGDSVTPGSSSKHYVEAEMNGKTIGGNGDIKNVDRIIIPILKRAKQEF
jgi:hypothetical protein